MGLFDIIGNTLDQAPIVGQFVNPTSTPIYPNRPKALTSLVNKYSTYGPDLLNQYGRDALQELADYDIQRANRGVTPLTAKQSVHALETLTTGKPYTPAPERQPGNVLANALADAKAIVTSIPRLPVAAIHEVGDILNFGEKYRQIQERPGGNIISDIAQAPGIRIIPGAYTVGNIARGDINEAVTHPLFTFLDVAPGAGRLLKETGAMAALKTTPIYQKMGSAIKEYAQSSRLGQYVTPMFDKAMREQLRPFAASNMALSKMVNDPALFQSRFAGSKLGDFLQIMKDNDQAIFKLEETHFGRPLLEPEAQSIFQKAVTGDYTAMTPTERAYVADLRTLVMEFGLQSSEFGGVRLLPNRSRDAIGQYHNKAVMKLTEYDPQNKWREVDPNYARQEELINAERIRAGESPNPSTYEIFDSATADRLQRGRRFYDRRRVGALSRELLEGVETKILDNTGKTAQTTYTPIPYGELGDRIQVILDGVRNLPDTEAKPILQAVVLALGERGVDISRFFVHGVPSGGFKAGEVSFDNVAQLANRMPSEMLRPQTGWQSIADLDATIENVAKNTPAALKDFSIRLENLRVNLAQIKQNPNEPAFYREAAKTINYLKETKRRPEFFTDQFADSLREHMQLMKTRGEWLNTKGSKYTRVAVERAERAMLRLEKRAIPARYTFMVDDEIAKNMTDYYNELQTQMNLFTEPEWAQISQNLADRYYEGLKAFDDVFAEQGVTNVTRPVPGHKPAPLEANMTMNRIKGAIERDMQSFVQQLRENGVEPTFVHKVGPRTAVHLNTYRILEHTPRPSQWKERVMDGAPYIQDMQISVAHQSIEIMQKLYFDHVYDNLIDPTGSFKAHIQEALAAGKQIDPRELNSPVVKTLDQLYDQFVESRHMQNRGQWDARADFRAQFTKWLDRNYTRWDKDSILTWQGARLNPREVMLGAKGEIAQLPDIYVPKPFMKAMQQLSEVQSVSGIWSPIMNAFRMAVLPFSPRFHVNNTIGGAIWMSMEQGIKGWESLADPKMIRSLLKEGEVFDPVSQTMIKAPPDFLYTTGGQSFFVKEFQSERGGAIARWFQDRLGVDMRKPRESLDKLVDASFRLNQVTDDLYRGATFISEHRKIVAELRKQGKSLEEAQDFVAKNAMAKVRKVMYSWDDMSPIERKVIRNVIPFYGFMRHALRFAFSFPIDHPFRTAVISAFTRAELEDLQTMPDKYLSMIPLPFFNGPDGTERFLNLTGANPFQDVADFVTLQGFANSMNPLIITLMQQIGFDPISGGPDQYGQVRWNPFEGRAEWSPPNLLSQFVGNIIPQTKVLTAMAGVNQEYNQMLQTNPDAASRYLTGALGVPSLLRTIDVGQETIKEQVRREEFFTTQQSEALKTGRLAQLQRVYPEYKPLTDQVTRLKEMSMAGRLGAYTPDLAASQNRLSNIYAQYFDTPQTVPQDLREGVANLYGG